MKFIVNAADFLPIAKTCVKALNTKDTHSQSVLKIVDNDLIINCSTQTNLMKGKVSLEEIYLEDDDKLEYSVDGQQLKTILSIIPQSPISIEFELSSDSRQFVVKAARTKLKLPVFDDVIFYKEDELENVSVTNAFEFVETVSNLSKILDTDATAQDTPVSCLHFIFSKENLTLMATNSIAIAEVKLEHDNYETNDETLLIPYSQLQLLMRTFDPTDTVQLVKTDNKFGYIDSDTEILTLVSKADIPELEYAGVKSQTGGDESIIIDSSEFKSIVSSLGKLALNSDEISFNVKENELIANNVNDDLMAMNYEMKSASDVEINFLKHSVSIIDSLFLKYVQLSWDANSNNKIVKFTPCIKEDEEFKLLDSVFIGVITNNSGD